MATTRTRRFPARLAEVANVWTFVQGAITGLPADAVMRVQLVVEELLVNTVTYGHGGDSDAVVDVTVAVEGDRITVLYEDSAPPFDPFAHVPAPDPVASLETRRVGHLGVFLLTHFAERYAYARTGDHNRVTVELPAR